LISIDFYNQDWEAAKTQLLKSYGTQMNNTGACKEISKLYQGSRSAQDYFYEVSQVCKVLIKLDPDLTFLTKFITEVAGVTEDVVVHRIAINLYSDNNTGIRKLQLQQLTLSWCKFLLKVLNQIKKIK
jgi:hypothetical protein